MTPEERLLKIEETMLELRELTECLPDSEQASRAIRTEEKVSRLLSLTMIPLLAVVAVVVLLAVVANQTRISADENRQGIQCILAELAEHRATNHEFNKAIAEQTGVNLGRLPKTLLPGRPSDSEIEQKCEQYHDHSVANPE